MNIGTKKSINEDDKYYKVELGHTPANFTIMVHNFTKIDEIRLYQVNDNQIKMLDFVQ